MSNVSFSDCDITRIRFSDKVTWGEDKFTIIEEKWLIEEVELIKKNKSKNKPIKRKGFDLHCCIVEN
jgi:hypothetical protein